MAIKNNTKLRFQLISAALLPRCYKAHGFRLLGTPMLAHHRWCNASSLSHEPSEADLNGRYTVRIAPPRLPLHVSRQLREACSLPHQGDPACFRNHTYAKLPVSVGQSAGTGWRLVTLVAEKSPLSLAHHNFTL